MTVAALIRALLCDLLALGFAVVGDMAAALAAAGCAGGMDGCLPAVAAHIRDSINASRTISATVTTNSNNKRSKTHFDEALHVSAAPPLLCFQHLG